MKWHRSQVRSEDRRQSGRNRSAFIFVGFQCEEFRLIAASAHPTASGLIGRILECTPYGSLTYRCRFCGVVSVLTSRPSSSMSSAVTRSSPWQRTRLPHVTASGGGRCTDLGQIRPWKRGQAQLFVPSLFTLGLVVSGHAARVYDDACLAPVAQVQVALRDTAQLQLIGFWAVGSK